MNKKKKKLKPIPKLKKDVWKVFSQYIRLRDCLATTGTREWGICITCDKRFHFKKLQCGHFTDGRHNSVLFDSRNSNGQCAGCNIFGYGKKAVYSVKMLDRYGAKILKELNERNKVLHNFKRQELEDIMRVCKDQIKDMGGVT